MENRNLPITYERDRWTSPVIAGFAEDVGRVCLCDSGGLC